MLWNTNNCGAANLDQPEKKKLREIKICVKKITSPSCFWAQILSGRAQDDDFHKLVKDIQQYYNDPMFSKSRLLGPMEGQKCVVRTDDRTWHRAIINKVFVAPSGLINYCSLVDEMECTCIPTRSVYETPPWVWQHPIQSACFALHGIAPAKLQANYLEERMEVLEQKNLTKWDPASCRYFREYCEKRPVLKAQIMRTDERNVIWVNLFGTTADEAQTSVNEHMLKFRYACVKATKSGSSNSADESDDFGSEGKHSLSMQRRVQHDKIQQLIKENAINLLSDSSDTDSERLLSDGNCARKRQKQSYTKPISRSATAPRKILGQLEDSVMGAVGSGNSKMTRSAGHCLKSCSNAKDLFPNKLPVKVSLGGGTRHVSAGTVAMDSRIYHRGTAGCQKGVDTKGLAVLSVATQTRADDIVDLSEVGAPGDCQDFSAQVDFDQPDVTMYKDEPMPALESTLPALTTAPTLTLPNAADAGSLLRTDAQHVALKSGFSMQSNDFYDKRPLLYNIEDEETPGSSEGEDAERDGAGCPAMKKVERSKNSGLKAVFTPDNLHSGSVILIRGDNPPNPISLFCKAPFSQEMQAVLETKLRYRGPRLIQAHVWPAILTRRDVLAISPRGGGKTLAYAAPIAHMVVRSPMKSINESRQPIAIVVTPDWKDVQRLHELFECLLTGHNHKIVAVFGGTPAENTKASEIAAGCDVLVCTAPSLVRICKAKYMRFSRLKHLVLDDINILVEEFTDEIREVMRMLANALVKAATSLKQQKPPQLVCMGSQWTDGVDSFMERFLKRRSLLLIGHPLEAAVYGNVRHWALLCRCGERSERLADILQDWREGGPSGGAAVFVGRPKDVEEMYEFVQGIGFYALKAHSDMCQWEIDEVIRQFDDESCHPVLVATDDVTTDLDVYSFQVVIHYSMPVTQERLGIRLSTMQNFFVNRTQADTSAARSFFLMSMEDSQHAPDLVKFFERLGQPVMHDLKTLASVALKMQETSKSLIPLCPTMRSLGHCRDEDVCYHRHRVSLSDKPNSNPRYVKIPTSGHVRVQVTDVVDATHYYVRIVSFKNESGEVIQHDATHAKVIVDLAAYFSGLDPEENGLSGDPLPGLVYAMMGTCDRVRVLQLTRPDSMSRKDTQEWSAARKQASSARSFVCWTTPGGSRKVCVRLVDTGATKVVRCDRLRKVPTKFQSIPFQAVEVRVCGIRPIDKDTKWLAQANEFIHTNLFGRELEGEIIAALGHTMWLSPAVIRSKLPRSQCTVTDFNVTQELVKGGYATKHPDQIDLIRGVIMDKSRRGTELKQTELAKPLLGFETSRRPKSASQTMQYISPDSETPSNVDLRTLTTLSRERNLLERSPASSLSNHSVVKTAPILLPRFQSEAKSSVVQSNKKLDHLSLALQTKTDIPILEMKEMPTKLETTRDSSSEKEVNGNLSSKMETNGCPSSKMGIHMDSSSKMEIDLNLCTKPDTNGHSSTNVEAKRQISNIRATNSNCLPMVKQPTLSLLVAGSKNLLGLAENQSVASPKQLDSRTSDEVDGGVTAAVLPPKKRHEDPEPSLERTDGATLHYKCVTTAVHDKSEDGAEKGVVYLCRRFCDSLQLGELDRLELLYELHMKSVGVFYNLSDLDMKGLVDVLRCAKTTQESRIIVSTLLSLTLDGLPVGSYIDLPHLVRLGCSVPYSEARRDSKKTALMKDVFLLSQAVVHSMETDSSIESGLSVLDLGEMILTIEKYLRFNATTDAKPLDEANFSLQLLRSYCISLKKKEAESVKMKIKTVKALTVKKSCRSVRKDPLDYSRFDNIDTTDTESLERPYSPVVCRFESTDAAETSDTDTLDNGTRDVL